MQNKTEIRKKIKLIRNGLNSDYISKISNSIVSNILQWDIYTHSKNILIYYPINSEISLLELLNDSSKSFYFPKVEGDMIFPVLYDKNLGFTEGAFNIKEPKGKKIADFSEINLILTPALSVDKKGNRLGYGKGYYDRYFSQISKNVIKAAIVDSKFFTDALPHDKNDIPVDYVITEKQIYSTSVVSK